MSLFGRTVLITGASRGIGRAIASACWRRGANLALLARSADAPSHPSLDSSLKDVKEDLLRNTFGWRRSDPLLLKADLSSSSREDISLLIQKVKTELGSLDAVVLNASAVSVDIHPGRKEFDLMMNLNVRSSYDLLSLSVPLFPQGGGSILSISPPLRTLSLDWIDPHPVYTSSKYSMSMISLSFFSSPLVSSCHTLWPSKLIRTSATRMLEERTGVKGYSSGLSPSSFSDAASILLSTPGRGQHLDSQFWEDRGFPHSPSHGVDDIFI